MDQPEGGRDRGRDGNNINNNISGGLDPHSMGNKATTIGGHVYCTCKCTVVKMRTALLKRLF